MLLKNLGLAPVHPDSQESEETGALAFDGSGAYDVLHRTVERSSAVTSIWEKTKDGVMYDFYLQANEHHQYKKARMYIAYIRVGLCWGRHEYVCRPGVPVPYGHDDR